MTVARSKPYFLDLGPVETIGDITRLPELLSQADLMFQQLYEDLAAVESASGSSGIASVVSDTNVTGSISGTVLTLGWAGALGVTRGGTGLSSVAQGDLFYGSAANTIAALAKNTTATRYLSNTGASNNPAWAQVDLSNGITGTLPVANGGTGLASYTAGDLLYASAATTLSKLAKGTATQVLHSGTTPSWSAVDLANDVTGNLPVGNLGGGTGATSSTFWRGDGTWATPSISTGTVAAQTNARGGDTASGDGVVGVGVVGLTPRTTSRFSSWTQAAGSGSNSQIGWATSQAGTVGTQKDATGIFARYTNNVASCGFTTNSMFTWWDHKPFFEIYLRTPTSLAEISNTAFRIWMVLTNSGSPPGNTDDIHTQKFVGVRWSSPHGANDSGWMPVTSDGTTQTVGSQISTIAAATTYTISIRWASATSAAFVINNSAPVTLTVNANLSGIDLFGFCVLCSTAGSDRASFDIGSVYLERN